MQSSGENICVAAISWSRTRKLGRMSVPKDKLDSIGVLKDVIFFGNNHKIEIWAKENSRPSSSIVMPMLHLLKKFSARKRRRCECRPTIYPCCEESVSALAVRKTEFMLMPLSEEVIAGPFSSVSAARVGDGI